MMPDSKHILWNDSSQTQYFLIPEAASSLPGNLLLRTSTGQEQSVNPVWAARFKVTEAQAKQHIMSQVEQAVESSKTAFSDFLGMAAHEASQAEIAWSIKPSSTPDTLLTDLLGLEPDDLRKNPELLKTRLGDLFDSLETFLDQAVSADPVQQATARQKLHTLQGTLAQHGIETDTEKIDHIPEQLRQLETERAETKEKLAEAMQELAVGLAQAAAEIGQKLEQEASRLNTEAENIRVENDSWE